MIFTRRNQLIFLTTLCIASHFALQAMEMKKSHDEFMRQQGLLQQQEVKQAAMPDIQQGLQQQEIKVAVGQAQIAVHEVSAGPAVPFAAAPLQQAAPEMAPIAQAVAPVAPAQPAPPADAATGAVAIP